MKTRKAICQPEIGSSDINGNAHCLKCGVDMKYLQPQHTPGPWKAIRGNVWAEEAGHYIVIPSPQMNREGDQSKLANARLIAAAPELLDILKRVTYETEFALMNGHIQELVRLTIAKAEAYQ